MDRRYVLIFGCVEKAEMWIHMLGLCVQLSFIAPFRALLDFNPDNCYFNYFLFNLSFAANKESVHRTFAIKAATRWASISMYLTPCFVRSLGTQRLL